MPLQMGSRRSQQQHHELGLDGAGRLTSDGRGATRRGSIPTMPGNAGLRTVPISSGSPGSSGLRTRSLPHTNGGGSVASDKACGALEAGARGNRRSGSRDGGGGGGAPAAPLSEEQLQALVLEYRNLALDLRDFEALDLQVGCCC